MYLSMVIVAVQLVSLFCVESLSDTSQEDLVKIRLIKKPLKVTSLTAHVKKMLNNKVGQVNLMNDDDIYYYGPIGVGSPPQTLYMIFNTGTADMWLPSRRICQSQPDYCQSHRTYNSRNSITYRRNGKPYLTVYNGGYASGYLSQDNIVIADLPVRCQVFAEATVIDPAIYSGFFFDGIVGMGFPATSNIGTDPPIFRMFKRKTIKEPVFAFYLSGKNLSESASENSEMVLGGVDPAHYTGNFVFAPINPPTRWSVAIESVYVEKNLLTSSSIPADIDTGTTLLRLPSSISDPINKAIGGDSGGGTFYAVDCSKISTLPDVYFTISGHKFVMHGADYILTATGDNGVYCYSAFVGTPNDYMVLGLVFLQKYYTQFDMGNNRIGFALAK